MATLIYDLDETLCTKKELNETYSDVKPIQPMIDQLNHYYNEGHTIIIQTARNMLTQNNDVGKVLQNVGEDTLRWLRENGVKYHSIQFGKAYGDFYIDDKSIRPYEMLNSNLDQLKMILSEEKIKLEKKLNNKNNILKQLDSIIDMAEDLYTSHEYVNNLSIKSNIANGIISLANEIKEELNK